MTNNFDNETTVNEQEKIELESLEVIENLPEKKKKRVKKQKAKKNATEKENTPAKHKSFKDFFAALDFGKCVFAYALGGVVGTLWETILNFCKGKGFVYCNGSIFTPFNFVYGFGALVIWIFLANSKRKPYMTYLYGTVGGGIVEYVLNFLEEKILGARSWDYTNKFLNINGRTTLPFMLFWGLLCLGVVYLVYNPLAKIYDKCPKKVMTTIAIVLLVIMVLDLTITVIALFRYTSRQHGVVSETGFGRFLDRVFNDDFMKLHFPNQKVTSNQSSCISRYKTNIANSLSF